MMYYWVQVAAVNRPSVTRRRGVGQGLRVSLCFQSMNFINVSQFVFFSPLRLDRSWVCPLLKVPLALTKPQLFRFRLAGFSGGQAKLRREECSGTFRKFISPSRSQKREGFFSDISCEQQVAFPEVKLMTTWILLEVLALGLVLTESLAIRQLQFRVSCHGTGSHGGL